ncbi:MAG TPA: hypothetical protein VGO52_09280 [Hyphomonadaceae bacterium]|nr:hypothetical protein [Hyphomonadaceae bacterium]
MTAMSEPAYLGEKTPFLNFATVKAIIRKDMRTLWPLAAAVAVMTFLMSAFFHETSDFPDLTIKYGRSSLQVGFLLFFLFVSIGMVCSALFVVMLAQQDRATDVRNDWMARPIKASELVLAKATMLAAVIVAPMALGSAIAVMAGKLEGDVAFFNWVFVMIACALLLTLGWLCSGIIQAILATVGVIILTLLMTSVSIGFSEVRQSMATERAVPAPAEFTVRRLPLPPTIPEPPRAAPAQPDVFLAVPRERPANVRSTNDEWMEGLPIIAGLFIVAMGGVGVTLWLLLGRRQVLPARLTFVSLYALGVLGLTQSIDVMVDHTATMSIIPAATLEQRMAAFRKEDANGDLKLNKAEYDKVLTDLGFGGQLDTYWPQRDVNDDGFIDAQEMQRDLGVLAPAATLEQRMTAFTQNDADKDGKLTKDEYAAALKVLGYSNQLEEYWLERDVNKDGFISVEEYVPAIQGGPAIQPMQF